MRIWLTLLLLVGGLGAPRPAGAQARLADSLQALLRTQPRPDTTRVRRLQALSGALLLADPPRATRVLEQALLLSRRLGDAVGEGQALVRLGTLNRRQADYARARRYTREAQRLFTQRHDSAGLAKIFLQWSLIESEQENPAASLRAALRGLPYAEAIGDSVAIGRLQVAIGGVYVQLGNYAEAVEVLRPVRRYAESTGDDNLLAIALNLLGNAYQQLHDRPRALACLNRAVRLNQARGDHTSAIIDKTNLSTLYADEGRLPQALRYARRACSEARATHDVYNLPPAELALARVYLLQGRTDSALVLARQAFAESQRTRSNESLRNGSDLLAQAYARRGDFAQAYRYQALWVAYKDSVSGIETQRRTAALRYGYELDRKQDQITLLTQGRELQAQKVARQRLTVRGLLAGLAGLLLLAGLLARNIFLKQRANRTLNEKNEQIALQRDRLDQTLTKLKATQAQLVQSEKMVALAALSAGVAHEIQNPLNFVNNFSEVSLELLTELQQEQALPDANPETITELLGDLRQNLLKINQHGERAAGIVKGMLDHAHADPGQCQDVDLNALTQDYLRLAYHSLQHKHPDFDVARSFDLDPALGAVRVVPQEIGRVLLNLFTNALYAVHEKAQVLGGAYTPAVRVRTRRTSGAVEVHVRDNGPGIAAVVMSKIFDPFFTTKPPGEGTGLGLWLSYDIVTKGYGGTLTARSEIGAFAEFIITLPQDQNVPVPTANLAEAQGE